MHCTVYNSNEQIRSYVQFIFNWQQLIHVYVILLEKRIFVISLFVKEDTVK
jgi:hypothetical protein